MKQDKHKFMEEAIALSIENMKNGGGPFGAVIVKDGKIIAKAGNSVTKTNDPTAHAEVNTIRLAAKSLNTFATEFKEKIESYKAPLMKIKMQLSPQNLGDVDVTLLNRGSTLHVNITSNSQSMALFMQNQAEFRNSLVNMGFSDLQMSFSQNQNGKNQQENKNKNANGESFESFGSDEDNTESIDIAIPNYV